MIRRLLDDERVRFVIIGGVNTIVGYGLFAVFELTFGASAGYLVSLYASYAIATLLAFALHRRFTFRAQRTGSIVVDFLRFQSVYVMSLVVNTIGLPLLVEVVRLPALTAQACMVMITTAISYFGHKYFSFRRAAKNDDAHGGG